MIDSINSSNAGRTAASTQTSVVRSPAVANTITQTSQRKSQAVAPVTTALAVPQSAKTGNTSNTKLPRGSLVDLLA